MEETAHSVYGGMQATYGIAQLFNYPVSGTPLSVAQALLSISPHVTCAFAALNILDAVGSMNRRQAFAEGSGRREGWWANGETLDNVMALIGNFASLGSIGDLVHLGEFTNFNSLMTLGGTLAGGFLILAATNFVTALRRYDEALQIWKTHSEEDDDSESDQNKARDNLTKATSDFGLATVNLIGWGLIAAAIYIPALATAAPTLLAIGGTLLALGGFYTLCSTVQSCYKAGGVFTFFSKQKELAEWREQEFKSPDYKSFSFAGGGN